MFDWLKDILGDNYSEDIDKAVAKQIGKDFVAKSDFNATKRKLDDLQKDVEAKDGTIASLKSSSDDVSKLQQQIKDLNDKLKQAETDKQTEIGKIKTEFAVDAALTAAGSRNNTAVKALMTEFLKNAKLNDDGSVDGLEDAIKTLTGDEGTSFLFESKTTPTTPGFEGMVPGNAHGQSAGTNKAPDDMSYDELSAYLSSNPGALNS